MDDGVAVISAVGAAAEGAVAAGGGGGGCFFLQPATATSAINTTAGARIRERRFNASLLQQTQNSVPGNVTILSLCRAAARAISGLRRFVRAGCGLASTWDVIKMTAQSVGLLSAERLRGNIPFTSEVHFQLQFGMELFPECVN